MKPGRRPELRQGLWAGYLVWAARSQKTAAHLVRHSVSVQIVADQGTCRVGWTEATTVDLTLESHGHCTTARAILPKDSAHQVPSTRCYRTCLDRGMAGVGKARSLIVGQAASHDGETVAAYCGWRPLAHS
jgi:hypothetical protein